MAGKQDFYDILGVPRNSTDKDIRKAYKRLARKYHPDVNPGDAEAERRFKEITEAHNVLSNPEKRSKYDQFGQAYQHAQQSGQYQDVGFEDFVRIFSGGGGGGGGFQDIFGDMFGRSQQRGAQRPRSGRAAAQQPQRGEDIEYELEVPFDEAIHGAEKQIALTITDRCQTCGGLGGPTETCPGCNGSGFAQHGGGVFNISAACPQCQGTGQRVTGRCKECGGSGDVRRNRKINLKIPAGVNSGQRIKLRGEGPSGAYGGPRGDLSLRAKVETHPLFTRSGNDIRVAVPVKFTEAALGGEISVPTVHGRRTLRVPAGTKNGQVLRMRGMGVKPAKGSAGDQLVKLQVVTPTKLSKEQRELLEQFAETWTDDPREGLG